MDILQVVLIILLSMFSFFVGFNVGVTVSSALDRERREITKILEKKDEESEVDVYKTDDGKYYSTAKSMEMMSSKEKE